MSRPAIAFVNEQQGRDLAAVLEWIADQASSMAELVAAHDPAAIANAVEAQIRRIGAVADLAGQLCGGDVIRDFLPTEGAPLGPGWLTVEPLQRLQRRRMAGGDV